MYQSYRDPWCRSNSNAMEVDSSMLRMSLGKGLDSFKRGSGDGGGGG